MGCYNTDGQPIAPRSGAAAVTTFGTTPDPFNDIVSISYEIEGDAIYSGNYTDTLTFTVE